jgi:hypothetical protein
MLITGERHLRLVLALGANVRNAMSKYHLQPSPDGWLLAGREPEVIARQPLD